MDYFWQLSQGSWSFSSSRRRISFGLWLRVSSERKEGHPTVNQRSLDPAIYQPLNARQQEIRLLILDAGKHSDPLRGRFITQPVHEADYEALSYEWGTGLGVHMRLPEIKIGDSELSITPNLDRALRHIRLEDKPRNVWADAVCMNQYDDSEKASQIQLMEDIYRTAKNVLVWLGLETEQSRFGMDILRYFTNEDASALDPVWERMPPDLCKAGLNDILGRSYFSRIWVIQEVALSQRTIILCGDLRFSWSSDPQSLKHFIRMIKLAAISPAWEQMGLTEIDFSSLLYRLELQQQRGTPRPRDIVDIAYDMRLQKATDRRDKIFGILGLCQDLVLRDLIRINYDEDVDQVYRSFVKAVETHE